MGSKTSLYQTHVDAGAKIVDFGGWDMPIHYGSQLEEHHVVRKSAGMFDVSHMTIVDLTGSDAKAYLQYVLANDVAKLGENGKALYSAMLDEQGGVLDDLIVYLMPFGYRLVVNCATREKDLAWLNNKSAGFEVELAERQDLSMIAVQGPDARTLVGKARDDAAELVQSLKIFVGKELDGWMFCRTGYTGEDGLEIMVPNESAPGFWGALVKAGVQPCGLGARDTLRLEAGMNLYGSDMDESVSPLESNMAWTVAFSPEDRDFIGRKALEEQKSFGPKNKLVGIVLKQKGILRGHQKVVSAQGGEGEITSGTFSPTLGYSVALARVPANWQGECEVEVRKKHLPVKIVSPPFVRNGERVYKD